MDAKLPYVFITCLTSILAKEEVKLPLCPTNIDYLPQDLPMHCRMPRNADFGSSPPGMLPAPPGAPFPFPGGPPGPPGPYPMPIPMMPMPQPSHKLPVIVMPFYSPDPDFKKSKDGSKEIIKKRRQRIRRRRPWWSRPHYSTDTDSDTDTETDSSDTDLSSDTSSGRSSEMSRDSGWWKRPKGTRKSARRSNRKHKSKKKYVKASKDLLTPVLQYVTKDGYVIFEKQISKNEAKDWLRIKQDNGDESGEKGANEDKENVPTRSRSKEVEKERGKEVTTQKSTGHKNHFRHAKTNSLLND